MQSRAIRFLGVAVLASLAGACTASRPVVYPNERVQQAGADIVAADIDECIARANEFATSGSRGGEVAKDAAGRAVVGAGVGAAAGAAGGAVFGDAGRGAASGAAGGAAAGLLGGMLDGMRKRDPDPVHRNFVTRCLQKKGYEVIGWQ